MSQSRAPGPQSNGHSQNPSHLIPVSLPDRPSILRPTTTAKATNSPYWLWLVKIWKYNVDQSSHWFKKLYFRFVFLGFLRFSYDVFDLAPPSGRDKDGRFTFLEEQGGWEERWQAEQEAAKYEFGHAVRVSVGAALEAETVRTEQLSPNSPKSVQDMYRRNGTNPTIEVPCLDLARLASKVESSNGLVERSHFRTI